MKKYRLADGRSVRVICTDRKHGDYPLVTLVGDGGEEEIVAYTADGFYCASKVGHYMNLVEVTEWDDLVIDEPVMVRCNNAMRWERGYFAGVKDGDPTAWSGGRTSWTTDVQIAWPFCRRPTKGELNACLPE